MKQFEVYLYRAPSCIRGWLAYITWQGHDFYARVRITAENGASAKNRAITSANNGFKGVEIICMKPTPANGGLSDDK